MSQENEISNATWNQLDIPIPSEIGMDDMDVESKKSQSIRYKQNTVHRDFLVKWVVVTNSTWLIAVIIILIAHGAYEEKAKLFHLSDNVIITLLGTTTVNVLGLAYIVLKGLFGEHSHSD